ncbi:MAG: hypothetical protein WCO11_09395 [Sphingomonadales bacterium]
MSRNTPKEWAFAIGGGLGFAALLLWLLRPAAPEGADAPPPAVTTAPAPIAPFPAPAAVAAPSPLALTGLRAGPDGGMAIVMAGGRQFLLRPGRRLPGGERLVRVEPGRAVLEGPAGEIALEFPHSHSIAATQPPPAAAAAPVPWQQALSPVQGDNGIIGWRIENVTALPMLAIAGLQTGDVLIAADDTPLTSSDAITSLQSSFTATGLAELRYRRGNQQLKVMLAQ